MSGFFYAWHLPDLLIPGLGLGSLRRTQATHFLRVRQQRPVDLDAIT
jgi:hypothetical protein